MKIVQSLWSKPGQAKGDFNRCSWPDKKYNYISWALSVLQFKNFYDRIELVTDEAGYDLLIKKMQLPYTDVRIVLDRLNNYNPDIWALGKLYAYSIQDEPFIHADGDVYIWSRFQESLEQAPLLCQNIEKGEEYANWYAGVFFDIAQKFEYYPEALDKSIIKNDSVVAINAGILGGNNIDFFKHYTRHAFEFIDRNSSRLSQVDLKVSNTIFEQFLFYALAEERGESITYYNPNFVRYWNELADFTSVPGKVKYIHVIGKLKKEKHVVECLEYRLQRDFPDYYYRIIHLLKTNQI